MPLLAAGAFVIWAAFELSAAPLDLSGKPIDPFASTSHAKVLIFARTDCPLTNRYAPELRRIAGEFQGKADFWLVYPDPAETPKGIQEHFAEYHFAGTAVRDPRHELVRRAQATVAPEAAVFTGSGTLVYHGRIDDRYIDWGKWRPYAQVHDLEDAIRDVLAGKPVAQPATRAIGCSLADVE